LKYLLFGVRIFVLLFCHNFSLNFPLNYEYVSIIFDLNLQSNFINGQRLGRQLTSGRALQFTAAYKEDYNFEPTVLACLCFLNE